MCVSGPDCTCNIRKHHNTHFFHREEQRWKLYVVPNVTQHMLTIHVVTLFAFWIFGECGKQKDLAHGEYGQLESHVQEIGDRWEDSSCS